MMWMRQGGLHRSPGGLTDHREAGQGWLAANPGRASAILDLVNGNIADVSSEMVGRAFAGADPAAKEVLPETVELLSVWLGDVGDMLDPDVLIVAAMLCLLFEEIRGRLPKYCINSRCQEIPLLRARYGADAGIAGERCVVCGRYFGDAGSPSLTTEATRTALVRGEQS